MPLGEARQSDSINVGVLCRPPTPGGYWPSVMAAKALIESREQPDGSGLADRAHPSNESPISWRELATPDS